MKGQTVKKVPGGVGGLASPLTVIVSGGFAAGAGLSASGEKFPYKSAVREHSDQADLHRPQTAFLPLKKVAAATFLTRCSGLISQAAVFQPVIMGNGESLFRLYARPPPAARHR